MRVEAQGGPDKEKTLHAMLRNFLLRNKAHMVYNQSSDLSLTFLDCFKRSVKLRVRLMLLSQASPPFFPSWHYPKSIIDRWDRYHMVSVLFSHEKCLISL